MAGARGGVGWAAMTCMYSMNGRHCVAGQFDAPDLLPDRHEWEDDYDRANLTLASLRTLTEALDVMSAMQAYADAAVERERQRWEASCDETVSWYPPDVFPPDGKSIDCASARFARRLVAGIRERATRVEGDGE